MTETVEELDLLGVLNAEAPDVVRLAAMVSIASRIEPCLLRRARLELCRGMEAGVELELWHSDLVQAHSPRAMTLHPALAHELQIGLCQSGKLDDAYDLLKECHIDLPEAIRLEEEMTWRILRGELASERVKRLLHRAIASLVEGGQPELAQWASRCLTRAPNEIRDLPEAWLLSFAASSRLGGARVLPAREAPPGLQKDELHWAIANTDHAGTLYVGVQNDRLVLSLAAPRDTTPQPAHRIPIPLTNPILVEIDDGQAPGPQLHQLDHGGMQVLELPLTGRPLKLTTVSGEVYEISVPVVPAASESRAASREARSQTGIIFEALNALSGDCLLLRYPGPDGKERLWIVDGGPRQASAKDIFVWSDVLLPRLREIHRRLGIAAALGMVSSADEDSIHGIWRLTNSIRKARPLGPGPVKFSRFWFNSLDSLLGPKPRNAAGEAATASLQSLVDPVNVPGIDDELATAIMRGVALGYALDSDLAALGLSGNPPFNGVVSARKGQQRYRIEGAEVTILGPRQDRLDALREAWAKALSMPTRTQRQAALQRLFQPPSDQDRSIPNLSSIVVLVEVGGRRLLLTGNAHGDDVVTAWMELGLGAEPVVLDVLKMPNHGSIRNCTERFTTFFKAQHYVFSADGTHGYPDPPTVEAVVKFNGARAITLHFTNRDIAWEQSYALEKGGKTVDTLTDLLAALHAAYGGPWTENFRPEGAKSVMVIL